VHKQACARKRSFRLILEESNTASFACARKQASGLQKRGLAIGEPRLAPRCGQPEWPWASSKVGSSRFKFAGAGTSRRPEWKAETEASRDTHLLG
jgi:hypothetical protein